MAAISITAASVLASASAVILRSYNYGATVTAGAAVYLDATPEWQLLDIDAASVGTNTVSTLRGIALNGGADGQPGAVCVKDPDFTPGGTLTNGSMVYGFTTAGAIAHDVPTTGSYPVAFGLAKSTTKMNLNPNASGAII